MKTLNRNEVNSMPSDVSWRPTSLLTPLLTPLDRMLDGVTTYRIVLYTLIGLLVMAATFASFGSLPFSLTALILSTAFLCLMCWAANTFFALVLRVPTNYESALITALILALILDPATSVGGFEVLGWAAILAMASKYLLAIRNRHIFNPAAIAAVIVGFVLAAPASWWVGTGPLLPFTLIGGVLVVRKIRAEAMAGLFVVVALLAETVASVILHLSVGQEVANLIVAAPLVFVGAIMLTEPLTAPTTWKPRLAYAALVGVLFIPQVHLGGLYSTPELALVVGNVFAYFVGDRQRVVLTLKRKTRLAPDVLDFAFAPSQPLAYAPGQYLECTLPHNAPDARGNRRYFTLASSPTEGLVRLGVRFYPKSSTFKYAMRGLNQGARIVETQVAGDFTLPADPGRKLVFLAGGIGITPFRSMLKYLVDTQQSRDIVLIYAASTPEDFVYRDVLEEAQARLGIRTVYTLTNPQAAPTNWAGERGRIDERMITQWVPEYTKRTYYLSGPPEMVRAHEAALSKLGIPASHVKKDFFPGLV